MKNKNSEEAIPLLKKTKVLKKLYGMGCKSEKALLALTMLDVLNIENISIQDIAIILEMQKHVKRHTIFSYLGGTEHNEPEVSGTLDKHT